MIVHLSIIVKIYSIFASTYSTWEDLGSPFSQTFTPNQQEYVVSIGNTFGWNADNDNQHGFLRIKNQTDTTYFSDHNSDNPYDYAHDRTTMTCLGVEQISTAKEYRLQISGRSGSTNVNHFQYTDLILWGLTTAVAAVRRIFVVT